MLLRRHLEVVRGDPVGISQICLTYDCAAMCWSLRNYDSMLSRFYRIPEHSGQTDGQTDGQNCYINIAPRYADAR